MAATNNIPRDCTAAGSTGKLRRAVPGLVLGMVLAATFCLKLHHLGHTALTRWDEVFHAIVARNLVKHPLTPTLVEVPYLPYDAAKWGENHVWLHKPILPLWQIALSFAALGVSTFALRLPSAVLSTGAAWLTYGIGTEMLDRPAALVAALLQAFSPFVMALVHGYQFADHIDVALFFWAEAGVYFLVRGLRTGTWRDLLLAGAAQGLAFLCKSYLALIILGIALAAWLLPVCRLGRRTDWRIDGARVLGLCAATLVVALPWQLYCTAQFPQEFWHEQAQLWRHLTGNVEGWAAPWDRVVFDYLIALYGVFFTPVLVAIPILVGKAVTQRHAGLWLLYAWGIGVLLPHLLAATKTPSATLLAMPPLWLLLGDLLSEAWRGARGPLAGLTGVLGMSLVLPAVIKPPGYGYPSARGLGVLMEQSLWVIDHVAAAFALVLLSGIAALWIGRDGRLGQGLRTAALVFCAAVLTWLMVQTVSAAWTVTAANEQDPFGVEVGEFVRTNLPGEAVLLCEERRGYEHLTLMFYADRTCYPLAESDVDGLASVIVQAGGSPYIVAYRRLPLPVVHRCRAGGPAIYRWRRSH